MFGQVQSNTHIEYHLHGIYSMCPSGTRRGDHVETTGGMNVSNLRQYDKKSGPAFPQFSANISFLLIHFCHVAARILRCLPAPFPGAHSHQFFFCHCAARVWRSLPAPVTGAPHTLWQCHVQSMRPCSHASCKHSPGMLSAQL